MKVTSASDGVGSKDCYAEINTNVLTIPVLETFNLLQIFWIMLESKSIIYLSRVF